jgi:hypothetical protein
LAYELIVLLVDSHLVAREVDDGWDWSQPFDDVFVAGAAVREEPGSDRAARARRVARAHALVRPGLAGPVCGAAPAGQGPACRGWLYVAVAATVVVILALVVQGGSGRQLGPRPPLASVAVAGGGPVPVPADARSTPIGVAPEPPSGAGGFEFSNTVGDKPVAFDPCRPVHYVLRAVHAPAGAEKILAAAFGELSRATGLVFVYDGLTEERYQVDRPTVDVDRYGQRYAPVLIDWDIQENVPELARHAGFAGPTSWDPDGRGERYVTGGVVLDARYVVDAGPQSMSVILHEFGHLVGLQHVIDPNDVMSSPSPPTSTYTTGALRGLSQLGRGNCFT